MNTYHPLVSSQRRVLRSGLFAAFTIASLFAFSHTADAAVVRGAFAPDGLSGTFSDGGPVLTFTASTDTGSIVSGNPGGLVFNEGTAGVGTYTINFDQPAMDFSFGFAGIQNNGAAIQGSIGNFSLTLGNGTVLSNADFNFATDPLGSGDLFPSWGNTSVLSERFVSGGNDFLRTTNQSSSVQSGGFISFTDDLSSGVTQFAFESIGSGGNFVANARVFASAPSSVPEPSSFLALGFVGFGLVWRRKRNER